MKAERWFFEFSTVFHPSHSRSADLETQDGCEQTSGRVFDKGQVSIQNTATLLEVLVATKSTKPI
jgi:hypothetical protein